MQFKLNESGSESVHVLLFSFMGFGHVNPILQLGRMISREAAKAGTTGCKVSMFISMVKEDRAKLTRGQLQEEPGALRVILNDVPCPTLQAGIEWYVAQDDPTLVEMCVAVIAEDEAARPGEEAWPKPTVIISDMFMDWGYIMSRHYKVPYWAFNPSPLTFNCVLQLFMRRVLGGPPVEGEPSTPEGSGKKPAQVSLEDARDRAEDCSTGPASGEELAGCTEDVPGLGAVPVECLPRPPKFKALWKVFERSKRAMRFAASVLANDVERLVSPGALALARQKPAGSDAAQFEVLCVGPLSAAESRLAGNEDLAVAAWLDRQAPRSVTLVVLGSWCDLCPADLVELARGLQASGRQVLWAFRTPNAEVVKSLVEDGSDESRRQPREPVDEASGLPVNFEQEVAGQILLRPWVNQPAVLAHPAVGCFLTHCGWNSLTESLALAGVPLLCLPLGADQCMNAFMLCDLQHAGLSLWRRRSGPPGLQREAVCAQLDRLFTDGAFAAHARQLQVVAQDAAVVETPLNLRRFLARAREPLPLTQSIAS